MRNLLLTLRFDGTEYHGWQVQGDIPTIQKTLQDAIEKVFGKRENIVGCSRTDSGVHANMFCCNFHTENLMNERKVIAALNANLPDDIAIYDCKEVDEEFHARYDCKSKEYIYRIWNSSEKNPFLYKYSLQYSYALDIDFLNEQSKQFLGTHDFKAFCSAGSSVKDTVRTIYNIEWIRRGEEVIFKIEADGFLYNMVRIIVGTLIEISQGNIKKDTIDKIIESKNREQSGKTINAQGLYLNKVIY